MELPLDGVRRRLGARGIVWQRAFVVASVAWMIVLPLAPLAASRPRPGVALSMFAYTAYAIGSVICHQIDVRCFHLWLAPLPVCARCTGIYAGAAAMSLIAISLPPLARRGDDARMRVWRRVLLLAILPTLVTVAYEWTTGVTPANSVRFVAGAPIGAAVAWIIREVN